MTTSPDDERSAEQPGSASATDQESLLKLGAEAAAAGAFGLIVWLAPVFVLGGLGYVLVSTGTSTTTGFVGKSATEITRKGWLGYFFLSLAVAVLAGRGTVSSLVRLFSAHGTRQDVWRGASNARSALVAVAALAAALLSLIMAVVGG